MLCETVAWTAPGSAILSAYGDVGDLGIAVLMLAKGPVWAYVVPPETFLLVWYTRGLGMVSWISQMLKPFLLWKWVRIAIWFIFLHEGPSFA